MSKVLIPVGRVRYNDHLHYAWWARCFRSQGHEVYLYGPQAARRGPEYRCPEYEADRPMADVVREVQPDLFMSLGPRVAWQGWKDVRCPKIALDCDFHYREEQGFRGASMFFVRDLSFVERAKALPGYDGVEVVWVPFSVDAELAAGGRHPPRADSVFFSGARQPTPYPIRSAAIDALRGARLLSRQSNVGGYLPEKEYYTRARGHLLGLACTSKWRLSVAKHVELAASGCAVLSDGSPGVDHLLPEYIKYTPGNVTDVVRDAIMNRSRTREIAARTRRHVLDNHTHEVRYREVCGLLTERGLL